MARLAASGGVRARFHETRRVSLLALPLETEGELYFAPPDRLARYTTHPRPSSIVVRGDRVALRDETQHQVVQLRANDVARHFVDNLAVVLRGDVAALRAGYAVDFRPGEGHGENAAWQLDLEPRDPRLRGLVEWIRFQGRGDRLTAMETRETSGDATVTSFVDVETGLDFTKAELERIFSLDAPAPAAAP